MPRYEHDPYEHGRYEREQRDRERRDRERRDRERRDRERREPEHDDHPRGADEDVRRDPLYGAWNAKSRRAGKSGYRPIDRADLVNPTGPGARGPSYGPALDEDRVEDEDTRENRYAAPSDDMPRVQYGEPKPMTTRAFYEDEELGSPLSTSGEPWGLMSTSPPMPEPPPESYAGRGPRSYERSDARIAEDVNDALTADPWVDPTNIEVRVERGVVTLEGWVNDRRQKREAEDTAYEVRGVRDVMNHLRLTPVPEREPRQMGTARRDQA